MWPWILGSAGIGATLGGIKGYQESGGDLGATLSGAAGGGVMGGITGGIGAGAQRMAGQALETALTGGLGSKVAPEAYKVAEALKGLKAGGVGGARQAAAQAGLQSPLMQQMSGLNILGKAAPVIAGAGGLAAGLAAPALAAPLLGAAGNLTGQAAKNTAQATAGLLGTQGPGAVKYDQNGVPIGTDRYGGYGGYSPADVLLGQGLTQRLEYAKNIEATRDAMRLLNPEIFAASEARSKTEFQRQMAAAGIRQNIATAANMLERSQQAAQQMGATAASQAGSALTSQYQYQ